MRQPFQWIDDLFPGALVLALFACASGAAAGAIGLAVFASRHVGYWLMLEGPGVLLLGFLAFLAYSMVFVVLGR